MADAGRGERAASAYFFSTAEIFTPVATARNGARVIAGCGPVDDINFSQDRADFSRRHAHLGLRRELGVDVAALPG